MSQDGRKVVIFLLFLLSESNKNVVMVSNIGKLLVECCDPKHPLHNPGDDDVSAVFIALATQSKCASALANWY